MSNRQNHDRQTTRNHPRRKAAFLAGSALVLLAVAGCSDDNSDFDISRQIGPNPYLPEQSAAILPDLKVAEVIGWKDGETPKVAEGLTVTAYAKDLVNPRRVYTLPNGDVLAVQSRGPAGEAPTRPKGHHPRLDHVDCSRRRLGSAEREQQDHASARHQS